MSQPIILTFDDGFDSHHSIARPLLRKRKLTATFFICGGFVAHPRFPHLFMSWPQILELQRDGFEIGSHLDQHFGMVDPNINHYANIVKLEQKFKDLKLAKPVTLSYPGFHVNAEAIKTVRSANYLFARAGCENSQPFDDFQEGGSGPHYNYVKDNPLNINCSGIFGKNFGIEEFIKSLENVGENEIPVYCFHSFIGHGLENAVQTDIPVEEFEQCLDFVANGPFETIRLRDIENYL